jgi:hypothetical protein
MGHFEFDGFATVARWLEEQSARPIRYEKVEPGEEQVLQQRELDSVDSLLALRREED